MKFKLNLRDNKIQSRKIYWGTIVSINIIVLALLIVEVLIDLRSTSLPIIIPLAITNLLILLLSLKFQNNKVLRSGLIILLYLFVEIHYLINPTTFHVIIYWLPFIPLIALTIQGLRSALIWLGVILFSHLFNAYFLDQNLGNSYEIVIHKTPFFITSIIYALAILSFSFLLYILLGNALLKVKNKNAELVILKTEIEEKKAILEKYQQSLIHLSKNNSVYKNDINGVFRSICATVVTTLDTNRVSIWLLQENNHQLVRKFLFEKDHETDMAVILNRKEYPDYFQALESKSIIMATDVQKHPETHELTENYTVPFGIFSILTCPILLDNKPTGVILCEQQSAYRTWHTEDVLFVQSIADFIALGYKNDRIKNLITKVREQNNKLSEKSDEIKTMNEELSALNEELITMNDTLEETVRQRTSELEIQNNQLTEYAFINSHLLRAPLSRILGLSHLISKEATSIKDIELINTLVASANELDAIIRKISDILYDGNHLTREEINSIIDRTLEGK